MKARRSPKLTSLDDIAMDATRGGTPVFLLAFASSLVGGQIALEGTNTAENLKHVNAVVRPRWASSLANLSVLDRVNPFHPTNAAVEGDVLRNVLPRFQWG